MPCADGRLRHRYEDGVCVHCGAPDTRAPAPQQDLLLEMEKQEQQRVNGAAAEESRGERPRRRRRKKEANEEEERMLAALQQEQALTVIDIVEEAKRFVAESAGYDWSGCEIEAREKMAMAGLLARWLDMVGWRFDSPRTVLAMLLIIEAKVTVRQYMLLRAQTPPEESGENASPRVQ